jgi:hypothetical protein
VAQPPTLPWAWGLHPAAALARPHWSEEQKKKLDITDPKGENLSFLLRLGGYWRGEKLEVIIVAPKSRKSERLMMTCICKGPSSAANKPGPASPSQGQRPDAIYRTTSDLGGRPGYLNGQLHLARPKVPSAAIPQRGPPGGGLQRGASCSAPPGTCRSIKAGRSTLSHGKAIMRFSSTWEADCSTVPSPRYWIVAKDTRILRLQDIGQWDPTQRISEGRSRACTRSPDPTRLARSWVGRSHLGLRIAATPPYKGYHG